MRFIWDEDKNEINIQKHGIDFVDVPEMFKYPMVTDIDNRKDYGEERWVGVGILETIIATVVYTEINDGTIRIISARKATKRERSEYENTLKNRF